MAVANAVLIGAGAGAKAGAYVADYFKNESVAQNLRIKGDQLISLVGKYAATELKVAAVLAAVGGSVALAQSTMDNVNNGVCGKDISIFEEMLGMCLREEAKAEEPTAVAKAKKVVQPPLDKAQVKDQILDKDVSPVEIASVNHFGVKVAEHVSKVVVAVVAFYVGCYIQNLNNKIGTVFVN
jgi:hypothetical protein